MENPGAILQRAQQNRRHNTPPPQSVQQPEPTHKPALAYKSGHANYNALMRSHDRMNSRHISPQGKT